MSVELWAHQKALIEKIRGALYRGHKRIVAVSQTGSGKSSVCAYLAATHLSKNPNNRVVWIAHRRELLEQAYKTLLRFDIAPTDVGIIAAGVSGQRCNPHRRVQVASIQTLLARDLFPPATLVIVDETHMFMAPEFSRCITAYPDAIIIAPTATPCRADGVGLGEHFTEMVVGASTKDLIAAGVLVPCEYLSPARSLGSKRIAQSPVKAWLEHGKGMRTVCFAPNSMSAEQYLRDFATAGVRAAFVHHQSPDRAEILKRYSAGEIDVLINQQLLSVGWDDPQTSCCLLARPCGYVGIYKQIIGRILRSAPGKTGALLIDLTGAVHVHGPPDADYDYSLDGEPIRRKGEPMAGRMCRVCGCPIPALATVCPDCSTETSTMALPDITGDPLKKFAWIRENHDEAKRRDNYMRWSAEAELAGHASGRAFYRYRSVYGSEPKWSWSFEYQKEKQKWLDLITSSSQGSATKRRSRKTTKGKQSDSSPDSELTLVRGSRNGNGSGV